MCKLIQHTFNYYGGTVSHKVSNEILLECFDLEKMLKLVISSQFRYIFNTAEFQHF